MGKKKEKENARINRISSIACLRLSTKGPSSAREHNKIGLLACDDTAHHSQPCICGQRLFSVALLFAVLICASVHFIRICAVFLMISSLGLLVMTSTAVICFGGVQHTTQTVTGAPSSQGENAKSDTQAPSNWTALIFRYQKPETHFPETRVVILLQFRV